MSIFFRILLLSAVYVCSANAAESPLNIQAISATGINNFRAPDIILALYSAVADSCTMVLASVMVTPMFSPQPTHASAKTQNTG